MELVDYWLVRLEVPTILQNVSSPLVPPTLKDLKTSHHPEISTLALPIPTIMIQDGAPSTVMKYAASFSAWQKWAEAGDINVLPTSGPELACYLVHLLQTTKSLACIQAAAFEVARAQNKACFPSPLQHTMVKQLLETCKRILGMCPKNRKTPLTATQVKELVLCFGGGKAGELQIVSYCPGFHSIPSLG